VKIVDPAEDGGPQRLYIACFSDHSSDYIPSVLEEEKSREAIFEYFLDALASPRKAGRPELYAMFFQADTE
jgi:hypothetical protein